MTEGQTLFAVFALLYLIECLRLMPSMAWMAAGAGKSRWGVIRPWSRLHVTGGSPLLLAALPPMNAHAAALPWLFVPAEDGLRVRLAEGMPLTLGWDSLQPRAEESTLHLDTCTQVRLTSPALAGTWARRISEWRRLAPDKRRVAFLKHARTSLDTEAAEKAAIEAAQRTRGLRRLATVLFVWCFGIISVVYHRFGDGPLVLSAAGVLLLLQFVQAWLFLRATRPFKKLVPHRRWRALGVAFLPQLAMRAGDAVSFATEKEPPHPLAWRPLLEDKQWLSQARQFWREARYVPGWTQNAVLPPEAEALRVFFTHEGIAEADYDPPATGKLPTCPRCGSEFQAGTTACKDCGGVELREAGV
ncbi:MAG: hypothetical protein ACO1TE_17270 [Prosthecobacter sp.]